MRQRLKFENTSLVSADVGEARPLMCLISQPHPPQFRSHQIRYSGRLENDNVSLSLLATTQGLMKNEMIPEIARSDEQYY